MEPEMIKRFLEIYPPAGELTKPDETLLNFGRQMLPPEILYLWENYGFGDYGNGLLKVVDPRDYMGSLYTWLGGQDFNKIPILVTAFGDIFYFRRLDETENDISLLNIHFRRIDLCTYSYREFLKIISLRRISRRACSGRACSMRLWTSSGLFAMRKYSSLFRRWHWAEGRTSST